MKNALFSTFFVVLSGTVLAQAPIPFTDPTLHDNPVSLPLLATAAQAKVGRYEVTTELYTTEECLAKGLAGCNPYAPILWKVPAVTTPVTLRLSLLNKLSGAVNNPHTGYVNVTNIHTHGLIVSTRDGKTGTAADPYGDSVHVTLCPSDKPTSPDCGGTHAGHGGGAVFPHDPAKPAQYQFDLYKDYESGLNWFHAHIHGSAQWQVSGGISGMLAIGDICAYADKNSANTVCKNGALDKANVTERFMGLRDMQLVGISGATANRSRALRPTFCANPTVLSAGDECVGSNPDPGGALDNGCTDPAFCRWVFTINGTQYPDIVFNPTGATSQQIWRIANMSADVTYRLVLRKASEVQTDPDNLPLDCNDMAKETWCRSFSVLNLDGVPANADSTETTPIKVKQLVLMPGSRAELLISHDASAIGEYRLDQLAVNTGGDTWPAVALARVIFEPPLPGAARTASSLKLAGRSIARSIVNTTAVSRYPLFDSRCVTKVEAQNGAEQHVTIGFQIDPTGNFQLATAIGQPLGGGLTTATAASAGANMAVPVPLAARLKTDQPQSPQEGLFSIFDPTVTSLCIQQDANITFHLLNFSPEIHNFHIHQAKFSVLEVTQPPGAPDGWIAAKYAGKKLNPDGKPVAVLHDTVPIPRAVPDPATPGAVISGMSKINMKFDRAEQVGKFVYHCHILEHEDGGMMASVQVVGKLP